MKKLSDIWWQWVRLGTEGYDAMQVRRLVVINTLISIPPLLSFPYLVLMVISDPIQLWMPACFIFFVSLLFLVTPFFHRFSIYAGGIYNLTLWCFYGLMVAYILGREGGVHFYFLMGAVSAMAILGVKLNILSLISITFGIGAFFAVETGIFPSYQGATYAPWLLPTFFFLSILQTCFGIFCVVYYAFSEAHRAEELLEKEYAYSERLLSSMMPVTIAQQLKREPHKTIADSYDNVTILFADVVNFTPLASGQTATETVELLSRLFTEFDALSRAHGVERIKTIGDSYMAAGGMPVPQDDHAERVLALALDMVAFVDKMAANRAVPLQLRIGIHSGPAMAGVIGTQKPFYDVWGGTVNMASRLESHGEAGKIHVSDATRQLLGAEYGLSSRGKLQIKGIGKVETYFVSGPSSRAAQ